MGSHSKVRLVARFIISDRLIFKSRKSAVCPERSCPLVVPVMIINDTSENRFIRHCSFCFRSAQDIRRRPCLFGPRFILCFVEASGSFVKKIRKDERRSQGAFRSGPEFYVCIQRIALKRTLLPVPLRRMMRILEVGTYILVFHLHAQQISSQPVTPKNCTSKNPVSFDFRTF